MTGLVGTRLETLSLAGLGIRYARFLAQKLSTLSPLIASLIEIAIVEAVNRDAVGFSWRRQEPAFPDAALLDTTGTATGNGIEVKAWHVLSTEMTGRFKESRARVIEPDIRIVVAAWALDHVVWGTPVLLGAYSCPAIEMAEARDRRYFNPPRYLVVEPGDTVARTRNLQQTQVSGYLLQDANPDMIESAAAFVRAHGTAALDPYQDEAKAFVSELMSRYAYRLETNFAKIDRIRHPGLRAFKAQMLATGVQGRSVGEWRRVFHQLVSKNEATANAATAAVAALF